MAPFNEDEIFDQRVRYVWVDEDGERVSHVHNSLGPALNFLERWKKEWDKVMRHVEDEELTLGALASGGKVESKTKFGNWHEISVTRLTLSGKRPAELKQVVIDTRLSNLGTDEGAVVNSQLERLEI